MFSKRALSIFKVQFCLFAQTLFILQPCSKLQRHSSVLKTFSFRKAFRLSKRLGKSKLLYKQYIMELPSGLLASTPKIFPKKFLIFFSKKTALKKFLKLFLKKAFLIFSEIDPRNFQALASKIFYSKKFLYFYLKNLF